MSRSPTSPFRNLPSEQPDGRGRNPFHNGSDRLPDWAAGAAACWDALVEDARALVAVIDEAGRYHFINAPLAGLLGLAEPQAALGRTMHEFLPKAFADERLAHIRRVTDSNVPVTIEGVWAGRWVRSTIRPITPGDDGLRRVLLVTVPVAGDEITADRSPAIRAKVDDLGPLSALTRRELDVLRLIGQGLSTAAIAARLFRSVKTIEGHRVSLGNKLKASNRVELARIAIRAGLVTLDDAPEDDGAGDDGAK
ncbi:MAG: PAS domain-containing protein [Phycisphaerales bacterium]|nr:PAS domain-containing protein [Phycisphaerales bacterium]